MKVSSELHPGQIRIIANIVVITIMGIMAPRPILKLQFRALMISPTIYRANMIVAITIVIMSVGQITVLMLKLTATIVRCYSASMSILAAY